MLAIQLNVIFRSCLKISHVILFRLKRWSDLGMSTVPSFLNKQHLIFRFRTKFPYLIFKTTFDGSQEGDDELLPTSFQLWKKQLSMYFTFDIKTCKDSYHFQCINSTYCCLHITILSLTMFIINQSTYCPILHSM